MVVIFIIVYILFSLKLFFGYLLENHSDMKGFLEHASVFLMCLATPITLILDLIISTTFFIMYFKGDLKYFFNRKKPPRRVVDKIRGYTSDLKVRRSLVTGLYLIMLLKYVQRLLVDVDDETLFNSFMQ